MNGKTPNDQNENTDRLEEKDPSSPSLEDLMTEIEMETPQNTGVEFMDEMAIFDKSEAVAYGQKQYVRFTLGSMMFAFPLLNALEIGQMPPITPLPNLPKWILGVSNIRGEIVSIVDLKMFFNLSTIGPNMGSRLIIIQNMDMKIGIIVDQIMGLLPLDQHEKNIQNNPYTDEEISDFIKGVVPMDDQSLKVLDIDRLLSSPRMMELETG